MKKLLSLLLCTVLVMSLFAGCGGEKEEEQGSAYPVSVGYAKADITPRESVSLAGYGDQETRFSDSILEPIYATCMAFADSDGEKVIYITHDLISCQESVFHPLRKQISQETGVPESHILFSASHSHSSPTLYSSAASNTRYYQQLIESVTRGAKEALADLSPATGLRTGFTRLDRTNTVRHYLLADGSYQGRNMGTVPKADIIGHYGTPDNLLQVAEFVREGKKSVVLVNWQGHPMGPADGQYNGCGPNYPGPLRWVLESKYDCEVAFVLGGSGNMNNNSQTAGELDHENYIELGTKLADAAYDLLQNNMTERVLDKVQVEENIFMTPDKSTYKVEVPLYALTVGEWACIMAPFEIFDTNAKAVKDASKFPMTFYASCSNGNMGYLPTPPSFDWRITYEAQITKFPKGMAELVEEQHIQMLDRLFTSGGYAEQEKQEGYVTPEFVPASDGTVYINPYGGDLTRTSEVQNGFYSLLLVKNGNPKKMLAIDKATAEKALALETMELVLNEQNVIVDVIAK